MEPMYCTREQVKRAINVAAPSWVDDQIDREIRSSSAIIDADMKRPVGAFWPTIDTRYFDWLDHQHSLSWRLWLNGNDLGAAPTQVLSGGVDITSGVLARNGTGDSIPPFTYLEQNLATNATFMATDSYQRAIGVTGLYLACPPVENPGGTLSAVDNVVTTATVSNSAAIGVGSVIRVDSERMVVTAKGFANSGLTIHADLAAAPNADLVQLASATVSQGELLLIDSEQMLVTTVAGTNAIVKRAWNGSALATHTTGATVYIDRSATVARGALGTAAVPHSANAPIAVHAVPAAVNTLSIAETLRSFGLERAGYTMVIERGSMTKVTVAETLWAQVRQAYRRGPRIRTAARFV